MQGEKELEMKKELIKHIVDQLVSYGYQVYVSKDGRYGFYTDGNRVVCFGGSWEWSVDFSGNYRPTGRNAADAGRRIGTGWQIAKEMTSIDAHSAEMFIKANAPQWAVKSEEFAYTTPEQHLKMYGNSSGYVKVEK